MSRHDGYDERFGELALLSYQVAYRLTGDRTGSEDAAQEVLTRAYMKWPRMAGHADAWVVRVTTNLVIGNWRRKAARPARSTTTSAGSDSGLADRLALTQALRSLPRRQREVAVLRYVGDLSIEQTAEAMGCSISSVKQHSTRALASLRSHLEAGAVDEPRRSGPLSLRPPDVTPRQAGTTPSAGETRRNTTDRSRGAL